MAHENTMPANSTETHEQVKTFLEQIRPAVQEDGGDVELVDITEDGMVQIRFHGACVGCPSQTMTLQSGIERNLLERVPQVKGVETVK